MFDNNNAEYDAVLGKLEPSDLVDFLPKLLGSCKIQAYTAGNLPLAATQELVEGVVERLQNAHNAQAPSSAQSPEARVVAMKPGKTTHTHTYVYIAMRQRRQREQGERGSEGE